jgi:hypothetical protein
MSNSKVGLAIAADTAATRHGQKPAILTDTYGVKNVPAAAKFGVGTSTREGAQQATDARRAQRPGDYSKR